MIKLCKKNLHLLVKKSGRQYVDHYMINKRVAFAFWTEIYE